MTLHRWPCGRNGSAPVAIMLLAVVAGSTAARAQTPGESGLKPGTVEHGGKTYDVEFGTLRVPMNRHDPDSKPIELQFVRYKSASADPGHPLVYLAGGPGGSGISTMRSGRGQLFLELLDERDFIAFDQRGTGRSEPRNVSFDPGIDLPLDQAGDPDRYCPLYQEAARQMLATMKERGIDVRGFTTEESADDLEALRDALGADKLVLWGSSYGTHLALTTARRHPDRIAAVILAGTEGPDHTFKLPSNIQKNLERLAELVREDPVYAERMPDLVGTVEKVLDDLESDPRTVTILPGMTVTVGKWDLQKAFSSPMGSRRRLQEAPAVIYAMAHGEYFDLARWAVGYRRSDEFSAMSAVMDCASYATAARLSLIQREAGETLLGAAIDFPYPCACEVAGMPRLPDEFRAPIDSAVPALFISGTLDGRTPVSNAKEYAQGFSNHQHLIVGNASHGGDLFTSSPKILEAVRVFLHGETIPQPVIDGPEWRFEPPYEKSLGREMLEVLTSEGYEAAVARYRALRSQFDGRYIYDFRESVLNELGYGAMGNGMIDLAIDIFRLNTVAYPEAFNTWDSLAEGYMEKGDFEKAVAFYRKSLELNPDNTNAVRMLERIGEKTQ